MSCTCRPFSRLDCSVHNRHLPDRPIPRSRVIAAIAALELPTIDNVREIRGIFITESAVRLDTPRGLVDLPIIAG